MGWLAAMALLRYNTVLPQHNSELPDELLDHFVIATIEVIGEACMAMASASSTNDKFLLQHNQELPRCHVA